MPLHLLGKKSWNVYNKDNVERVRRDEAAAAAHEEAEEQRMQDLDAERRTAILRGEKPPPLPTEAEETSPKLEKRRHEGRDRERKRRKLRGEDDTDRDIRFAREDVESGEKARVALSKHSANDAPLHDHAGHINLFPAPDERQIRKSEKNAEAEADKAKKKKEFEDQYTMRFSNAAGFKQGLEKPWYAAKTNSSAVLVAAEEPGKDVWGNEDPRRKDREKMRASASDPMAFMQKAQTQLKQAEKDKEKWQKARERELEELERAQEKERRRDRRYRRHGSVDSLEGFSLDTKEPEVRSNRDRKHHHSHHHRRSSRSRSREHRHRSSRHEHRRRSRSPRKWDDRTVKTGLTR